MILKRKPFTGILAFLIVLFCQPLGHAVMVLVQKIFGETYQFIGATGLGVAGFVALALSLRFKGETVRTVLGYLAGVFLWTGCVEFAYVYYGIKLAVPPEMVGEEVVTKPEYLVMPSSIGILIALLCCILFNGHTRCNFFMWFRRRFRMSIVHTSAKLKNYAVVTAVETIFVLWFFYILMMIVYGFGDRAWPTWAMFFGCLLWSLYLIWRLLKYAKLGPAIRYAVPTAIIFWISVEVLGRWDFFTEIWVEPIKYLPELGLIVAALVGAILLVRFIPEREQRPKEEAPDPGQP